MESLKQALIWIKKNGLIVAFLVYIFLFFWSMLLIYTFVAEALSIAQRGYFLSVPRNEAREKSGATDRRGLKGCSLQKPCPLPPDESLTVPIQKE